MKSQVFEIGLNTPGDCEIGNKDSVMISKHIVRGLSLVSVISASLNESIVLTIGVGEWSIYHLSVGSERIRYGYLVHKGAFAWAAELLHDTIECLQIGNEYESERTERGFY